MRIAFTEEAVNSPPPGLEGWGFFRVEYGADRYNPVAVGHIWLPPGVRPDDEAAIHARILTLVDDYDRLLDAVVDAVGNLDCAENGGDVTEALDELCERTGVKRRSSEGDDR